MQQFKFNLDAHGMGTVTLDGQPVECRSIEFKQRAGEPASLILEVFAEVEGTLVVKRLVTESIDTTAFKVERA